MHYNETKVGVDIMDQMVNNFTTRRATKRWTLALFENFLDISALNSFVIWMQLNPNFAEKRDKRVALLRELISELIIPHVKRRLLNLCGILMDVLNDIRKVLPEEDFELLYSKNSLQSRSDEPQIDPTKKLLF